MIIYMYIFFVMLGYFWLFCCI